MQGALFARQCTEHFPAIETLQLPENYRSVPSVVHASVAVLNATVGGRLHVPAAMRQVDQPPVFVNSGSVQVRAACMVAWELCEC